MRLGIDFDNTLVSYDGVFRRIGLDMHLLPVNAPEDKSGIRGFLIDQGREHDFTILQGSVYGPGLKQAKEYSGVRECLRALQAKDVTLFLVSHKTRLAVAGEPYDLHAFAWQWLRDNAFTPDIFPKDQIFFETTRKAKLERIASLACTHFIDDLPAIFADPSFPMATQKLWFAPCATGEPGPLQFSNWRSIQEHLLGELANA